MRKTPVAGITDLTQEQLNPQDWTVLRPISGRVYSLWELMDRFNALAVAALFTNLEIVRGFYFGRLSADDSFAGYCKDRLTSDQSRILQQLNEKLDSRLFSASLRAKGLRLKDRLDKALSNGLPHGDISICITLLDEFKADLQTEFNEHVFLKVDGDHVDYWLQNEPLFPDHVMKVFPDIERDAFFAGRCFASEQGTETVFHLMRVLELGLRAFSGVVGLDPVEMAKQNWQNVIDLIEKEIRILDGAPNSTPQKAEKLTAYSEAATQFRYFKNAWRNHVSHAREFYDMTEADRIFTHVRTFMGDVAKMITP